jgi:hypothetical protein
MAVIKVTPEQVRAAKIEVAAFRSAGLEPDPLAVRLAEAKPLQASSTDGPQDHSTPDDLDA